MYDHAPHQNHDYRVTLRIPNTCIEVLQQIQVWYGGSLGILSKRNDAHKDLATLAWYQYACVPVLEDVFPYLIVKKKQCELALAFLTTKFERNPLDRRKPCDDDIEFREFVRYELSILNRRGNAGS